MIRKPQGISISVVCSLINWVVNTLCVCEDVNLKTGGIKKVCTRSVQPLFYLFERCYKKTTDTL